MAASPGPVRRIVIVGGGVAGWTAAAALAKAGGGSAVTVVETAGPDESIGGFGPAEPTLPAARQFHSRLGIDEDALVRSARGSFALGIAFSGWATPGRTSFTPFGDVGAPMDSIPFHQLVERLRHEGREVRLADFSLAALAAQASRFARPADDPASVLSTYSYGLHLDRSGLAAALRAEAQRLGVRFAPAPYAGCERGEDGNIAAVRLEGRERIAGDLFIDASGNRALLIGEELQTAFESWRGWLPCDRTMELACESELPPAPYATSPPMPPAGGARFRCRDGSAKPSSIAAPFLPMTPPRPLFAGA